MNKRLVEDEEKGGYWELNDSNMTRRRILKRDALKRGGYIRTASHAGIMRFKLVTKGKGQAKKVAPKKKPAKKIPVKKVPVKKKTSRKTRKKRAVSPQCSEYGRGLRRCRRT